MKLNKNGWGLRAMIIYSGILIIFLAIAIFTIYRFYDAFRDMPQDIQTENSPSDSGVNTNTYQNIEQSIKNASITYVNEYYESEEIGTADIIISISNLVNHNYISQPKDLTNNTDCTGYALVKKENNQLISTPYLKCQNYTSTGYQEWRIGE